MKKTAITAMVILGALVVVLAGATTAGADKYAQFNFGTNSVTLTIPTPSCRPTHNTTSCRWELVVFEQATGTNVGQAVGTSGVLSVAYPAYCGTITVEALVGPPLRKEVAHQRTLETCSTPVRTQVTTAPDAVTAQVQPGPSTQPTDPGGPQLPFTGAPIFDILGAGIGCLALAALCLRRRSASWNRKAHLRRFDL